MPQPQTEAFESIFAYMYFGGETRFPSSEEVQEAQEPFL